MKPKTRAKEDRHLAVVWRDEDGVPTGQVLTYFAEIPGDREGILESFSHLLAFQLLGDFGDAEEATTIVMGKIQQIGSSIPPEERVKWPSDEDRRYVEICRICGFTYCPRLPKDAQQHDRKHAEFLAKQ
jgi:hypothetical protein